MAHAIRAREKILQNPKSLFEILFREEWIGMRPMVYDDLPIIGRPPDQRNLVIATGHGMSSISMATSTGKLVSEIIAGCEPHIDPTAFGVDRFNT